MDSPRCRLGLSSSCSAILVALSTGWVFATEYNLKLKLNFIQILLEKITALKASYTAFVFSKGRR